MNITKLLLIFVAAAQLSACLTPVAYVDPQYRKARFETLAPAATTSPVKLSVHYLANGRAKPDADARLARDVSATLNQSKVLVVSSDAPALLDVQCNNIGDANAAMTKGIGVGITLGLSGNSAIDRFEFSFRYTAPGKDKSALYRHLVTTTLGQQDGPSGQNPVSVSEAFSKVVEDSVLNFIAELQASGTLKP